MQSIILKTLAEFSRNATQLAADQFYDRAVQLAMEITAASSCELYLYHLDTDQFEQIASTANDLDSEKPNDTGNIPAVAHQAMSTYSPSVDAQHGTCWFPIMGAKDNLGVLSLYFSDTDNLTDSTLAKGSLIAAIIAQAMSARQLQRQATVQGLQIEALNSEMEAMVYAISHDLDAPIRAIQGYSAALVEDYTIQLGEEGAFYAQRMQAAGDQIEKMTQSLVRLSRIAQSPLQATQVNLSKLAQEIRRELEILNPDRTLDWQISHELWAVGDQHLLRVLLNALFGNAIKFSPQPDNQPTRITFESVDSEGSVAFAIRDNGSGFDMKHHDRLFRPFETFHNHSESDGIGLAIASRIVNRHRGRIWAESQIDTGTSIYFTLPLTEE